LHISERDEQSHRTMMKRIHQESHGKELWAHEDNNRSALP
jgi:hypothetical protein